MGKIWSRIRKIFQQPPFSGGGIYKRIFSLFPNVGPTKHLFGQPKAKKTGRCYVVSVSPSGLVIRLQVSKPGVCFFFGCCGVFVIVAIVLFVSFLFNNCTWAFDDKS